MTLLSRSRWLDDRCRFINGVLIFDRCFRRTVLGKTKVSSCAYPWLYSAWAQNALTILPDVNLISNIGFSGEELTVQIQTLSLPIWTFMILACWSIQRLFFVTLRLTNFHLDGSITTIPFLVEHDACAGGCLQVLGRQRPDEMSFLPRSLGFKCFAYAPC